MLSNLFEIILINILMKIFFFCIWKKFKTKNFTIKQACLLLVDGLSLGDVRLELFLSITKMIMKRHIQSHSFRQDAILLNFVRE